MPKHNSNEDDIKLAEELAKNFSYKALDNFLFKKDFSVDLKQNINSIENRPIEEYGIKKLQRFATKKIDQQNLYVYTLELTTNLTERSSKKRQFEIAKKLLNIYLVNTGLFIFYDNSGNFRFSLVYKEPLGTKARYSFYKRYTFYVSSKLPNKTFVYQIGECDFKTFESIKAAFSVEPVTQQFYKELQNWYYYALDKVWFPEDYKYSDDPRKDKEIRTALNLIRLITRLIFIWFLKEKELIPDVLFDREQLKSIVKDFGKGHNYYNAILQNLFFATLNRPVNERGWAFEKDYLANKSDFGVKSLYRYEDKFLIPPDETLKLFSEIPFINGGLFDCLDKDSIYVDGFSKNPEKQAKVPDYLFFQEEELTVDLSKYSLSRNAKVRGLIDILKSYNFTTDEATPIDQEIALDPELLGKVFENLLASYNPETATTARKATGSYYTPREIVDYMVDESLKEYFKTALPDIPEESIELLLSYSDNDSNSDNELNLTKEQREAIAKAIDNLKIIDPACGSGAFPMGILHKLVHILQKIDPDNEIWYEIQLEKALQEADEIFKTEKDKEKREELLRELNENFDTSINEPDYARKLYLIENCIYGIDIQPIAIQISKLRFFISLILDQKVDRSKPNFGILPLPNLETNFIAANTLIGLEKPKYPSFSRREDSEITKLEPQLKNLRHRYFRIKSREEKIQMQNQYKELRKKLKKALIREGWNDEVAEKIAKFDIFDQNASADWFDPEWMFGIKDGFNIVIGNPPYVREEHIKDKELIINSISKCFIKGKKSLIKINKRSDLYIYFYYRGLSLLKTSGVLCYISSNSWLDVEYGIEFQEFLLKYMHPLMIVDNVVERTFEASINTIIVLIKKPEKISLDDVIKFVIFKKPFKEILNSETLKIVRQTYNKIINNDLRIIPKTRKELWIEGIEIENNEIKEKNLWNYKYIGNKWGGKYLRAPEIFFKILEKGKDKLVKLGDIAEVKFGIKTGANKFFYLEPTGKTAPKGLLHVKNSAGWEGYIEEEFLKPVIKSPKELKTIIVREEDLKYKVFICHKSKNELKGTYALKYIEWGEKQEYHKKPTCASRQKWWDLGKWKISKNILPMFERERNYCFYNYCNAYIDATLYWCYSKKWDITLNILLNSTLVKLWKELLCRPPEGGGGGPIQMKVYHYSEMPIPIKFFNIEITPELLKIYEHFINRKILSIFEELGFPKCTQKECPHPEHPYEYVNPNEVSFDRIMPDRRELDKIVFKALGLTEEEQLEVYKAVVELVKSRLLKAKSK